MFKLTRTQTIIFDVFNGSFMEQTHFLCILFHCDSKILAFYPHKLDFNWKCWWYHIFIRFKYNKYIVNYNAVLPNCGHWNTAEQRWVCVFLIIINCDIVFSLFIKLLCKNFDQKISPLFDNGLVSWKCL